MPKVTFITASYNYAQFIGQTIESIINQTYKDWELLVIDDGSKDNSINIINKYTKKDGRIKLLTHEHNENKGLIKTLQLGIKNAQGKYIVFLESDDYITKDYLEQKLKIFEKYENVGFIYNDIKTFGEKDFKLKRTINLVRKYWKTHDYPHNISELLYLRNYIPTFSCVMLEKNLLNNLIWDSPYPPATDLWLWAQISQKTMFYYISYKLTYWRIHKDSYLKRVKNNYKQIIDFYNSLYLLLPPIKSQIILFNFILKRIWIFVNYSLRI